MDASDKPITDFGYIKTQENINLGVTSETIITICNDFSASDEKEIIQSREDSSIACMIKIIIE